MATSEPTVSCDSAKGRAKAKAHAGAAVLDRAVAKAAAWAVVAMATVVDVVAGAVSGLFMQALTASASRGLN